MIGPRYWTTGVTVWRGARGFWQASLDFLDDGFAEGRSTEGSMRCRYGADNLSDQVDLLVADATRLGIEFKEPTLYYNGDGEDPDFPPPADWNAIRARELERLGWKP